MVDFMRIGCIAAFLSACTPDFTFDSPCDRKNHRLEECVSDASVQDAAPPALPADCGPVEKPCNDIDDDCNLDTPDPEEPGFVCQTPGSSTLIGPERPVEVTFTYFVLIQETEVTRADWDEMVERNRLPAVPCPTGGCCQPGCPVVQVSWKDAALYANERTAQYNELNLEDPLEPCYRCPGGGELQTCGEPGVEFTGLACSGFRLPTEAEWLRAATDRYAALADQPVSEVGHFDLEMSSPCAIAVTNRPDVGHHRVDGLRDLLGNVAEWVQDGNSENISGVVAAQATDPIGPTRSADGAELPRRVRGASACTPDIRTARHALEHYVSSAATIAESDRGFRLARTTGWAIEER